MKNLTRRGFVQVAGIGAVSLSLGGVLSACAGGDSKTNSDGATGNTSQVIVAMGVNSEPAAGFDPFVSWGCGEHVHEPLIQSTLVNTDYDMNIVNDLATSYELSEDGLTWTFVIRDDAKFTDGEPLTAEDVAFTINGIIESPASEADFSMVEGAVAEDDTTVIVTMKKPYNAFLYTLAVVGIVPAHAHGSDYGSNPIGSGRYMLEQWDRGQQVILVANPDYYGDAPKIERVIVVFMEEDAALASVQSGQADIAYTSAIYSDQTINGFELFGCQSVDCRGISLPTIKSGTTKEDGGTEYEAGNDVTADHAIRQAINYAVERSNMIDNVLNGYGTAAYSVADDLPWGSSDMKIETDVSYAEELLDEAGWKMGDDGIREKDGLRASIPLLYSTGDSVRQSLAAEFANQMAGIGIEVIPEGLSWDDIYARMYADPILWGWGSNSPTELYSIIYSKGVSNFASYENDAVDAACDAALATPIIEDSYPLWQEAQWNGKEGVAPQGAATWVWLANIDHLYFKRDSLVVAAQKIHPHGHGWSLVNNVDQWSWNA